MALLVFSDSIPISGKVAFTEFESQAWDMVAVHGAPYLWRLLCVALLPSWWITLFIFLLFSYNYFF